MSQPSQPSESFFKVKDSKRSTKKNTKREKYKRNGKYTSKGTRAKQSILFTTQRVNSEMSEFSPRDTVVGTVLNRDKMQSIALPPKLQKEPQMKVIKATKKKPQNLLF